MSSLKINNDASSCHSRLCAFIAIFKWFSKKGYAQGVFWVLLIAVISSANDVLMRTLGARLHDSEITFFRFFFSFATVIPFLIIRKNENLLKTNIPILHFWRGFIGAIAIGLCCWSVNRVPLSTNTTIMFTQQLFFLPLAYFFLKENVDRYRWIATIIGFTGAFIVIHPGADSFHMAAIVPLTAAFLFAIISMLAKKMIAKEHPLTLLFYFGLVTTLASLPVMLFFWTMPTVKELFLLLLLGGGANLIQVCIFKAFSATDASAITPIFYTEIGIASLFGFIFFGQIPTLPVIIGAFVIIGSTFMISVIETKKEKSKR